MLAVLALIGDEEGVDEQGGVDADDIFTSAPFLSFLLPNTYIIFMQNLTLEFNTFIVAKSYPTYYIIPLPRDLKHFHFLSHSLLLS